MTLMTVMMWRPIGTGADCPTCRGAQTVEVNEFGGTRSRCYECARRARVAPNAKTAEPTAPTIVVHRAETPPVLTVHPGGLPALGPNELRCQVCGVGVVAWRIACDAHVEEAKRRKRNHRMRIRRRPCPNAPDCRGDGFMPKRNGRPRKACDACLGAPNPRAAQAHAQAVALAQAVA